MRDVFQLSLFKDPEISSPGPIKKSDFAILWESDLILDPGLLNITYPELEKRKLVKIFKILPGLEEEIIEVVDKLNKENEKESFYFTWTQVWRLSYLLPPSYSKLNIK